MMVMQKKSKYLYAYMGLIIGVLIFGFANSTTQDCDIWWHLQNGKMIFEYHQWPSPDQYSYITHQTPWIVHSWLADCFFYVLYKYGGYSSLEIVRIFVHLTFAVTCSRICYRKGVRLECCIILSFLAMYLVCDREVRPFIFSELGALAVFYLIRNPVFPKIYTPFISALSLIWVNVHPMSIIFSIYLAIILIVNYTLLFFKKYYNKSLFIQLFNNNWILACLLFIGCSFVNPNPIGWLQRIYHSPAYGTFDWQNIYFVT